VKSQNSAISLDHYLKLKEFVDATDLDVSLKGSEELCEIIPLFKDAQARSLAWKKPMDLATRLDVIQALIFEYEEEMLDLARECDPATWQEKFGKDPIEQIERDVYKLNRLVEALSTALAEKGAADLPQACESLRAWADPEILATLDYVMGSDYPGFQKVRLLLEDKVLESSISLQK